ncbi:hypothetical protein Tco_0689368 [Tanacetum coccineum]
MHANSHHKPLLVVTVALQRGVATAAAVGPAQVHHLSLRLNRVCIGILACRGLSLISSPLHAIKSPSQIQSSAVVKFEGVTMYCSIVSAIASASSSSEYSWSESRLKSGDLNLLRLRVLKCLLEDQNSCSGSLHGYAVSSLMDTAYWSSE